MGEKKSLLDAPRCFQLLFYSLKNYFLQTGSDKRDRRPCNATVLLSAIYKYVLYGRSGRPILLFHIRVDCNKLIPKAFNTRKKHIWKKLKYLQDGYHLRSTVMILHRIDVQIWKLNAIYRSAIKIAKIILHLNYVPDEGSVILTRLSKTNYWP